MHHTKLDLWKESMNLVKDIFELTNSLPKSEEYGLKSQLKRAVISIPSNVAEGSARKGNKEVLQFVHIAMGSLAEIDTLYRICLSLNYTEKSKTVESRIITVRSLLIGFRNHIRKKPKTLNS